MTGDKRRAWGQAYRDGSLICGRVHVKLDRDRPGAAPPQRRTVIARFEGCLHPTLRAELTDSSLDTHHDDLRDVEYRFRELTP